MQRIVCVCVPKEIRFFGCGQSYNCVSERYIRVGVGEKYNLCLHAQMCGHRRFSSCSVRFFGSLGSSG